MKKAVNFRCSVVDACQSFSTFVDENMSGVNLDAGDSLACTNDLDLVNVSGTTPNATACTIACGPNRHLSVDTDVACIDESGDPNDGVAGFTYTVLPECQWGAYRFVVVRGLRATVNCVRRTTAFSGTHVL